MTEEIRKLIAENRLRPIEKAPKDGTMVLLYNGDTIAWNEPIGGHWQDGGWVCQWNHTPLNNESHFRALPSDALADVAEALLDSVSATLEENLHLADGDNCTLIRLKQGIQRTTEIARKK